MAGTLCKPVAVCGVAREVAGQVDNVDGLKRALLHANATTNTQFLGNEGNLEMSNDRERCLGGGINFDTQLAHADNRARLLALLSTLLGLAFVFAHNGDTRESLRPVR